jgi:CPA2 family monovalent cation:H+ antiporter-2
MSMALGAFIAGLLLAETEFRREVEVTIEPFKGLLLGLFFLSVGAGLDLARVLAEPFQTIGIALALIVGKLLITYVLALLFGVREIAAREAALVNAPGGEFAFVMLGAAALSGLLERPLASQLVLAVTLSMITIPLLAAAGARMARSATPRIDPATMIENHPETDKQGHVIVVGYGRVGALVGDMLTRHKIPFVAIDGDAPLVARTRNDGLNIFWGDASRPDFLRKCGISGAKAVVVTMDAPAAVDKVVQAARALRADLTIVARARDAGHAAHLYEIGATDAVPETLEASLQLAEALLVDIGVPSGYVIASIHEKRDEYRAVLQKDGDHAERRGIRLSRRIKDMSRPKKAESTD